MFTFERSGGLSAPPLAVLARAAPGGGGREAVNGNGVNSGTFSSTASVSGSGNGPAGTATGGARAGCILPAQR